MHIDFIVEEPSAEYFLESIIPKIFMDDISYKIHTHQCKQDLLNKLPNRLKGYSKWIPDDTKIFILVDNDTNNCHKLKEKLELAAINAGLYTKSKPSDDGQYQVTNRIAIEELEAWFWGDLQALKCAYPRISMNLDKKEGFRNPDAIKGGTWEALERELQRKGYYKEGLRKQQLSQDVSKYIQPLLN